MAFFGLLAGILAAIWPALPVRATTSERVVTNRYSGLAIEGFDPVAYFTDRQPAPGDARSWIALSATVDALDLNAQDLGLPDSIKLSASKLNLQLNLGLGTQGGADKLKSMV